MGSLILAMLAGTAWSQPSEARMAVVTIESHGYSIEKTHYDSVADLVRGLKAIPNLDAIGLTLLPDANKEQLPLTIKAIHAAGLSARIAVVGNDVFYK
jgi:hypothetical protein